MASLAGRMADIDSLIFGKIGEIAILGSHQVQGIFKRGYREIEYPNGTLVGLDISFDCQYQDFMGALVEGDPVTIKFSGTTKPDEQYRFVRRIPPGGDESGLVILELGSVI